MRGIPGAGGARVRPHEVEVGVVGAGAAHEVVVVVQVPGVDVAPGLLARRPHGCDWRFHASSRPTCPLSPHRGSLYHHLPTSINTSAHSPHSSPAPTETRIIYENSWIKQTSRQRHHQNKVTHLFNKTLAPKKKIETDVPQEKLICPLSVTLQLKLVAFWPNTR